MKKMPVSSGRPRTHNYTMIREMFEDRKKIDPSFSKAALARELGLSTRTVRGIINGTYERRFLAAKAKNAHEETADDEERDWSSTLMVAWC